MTALPRAAATLLLLAVAGSAHAVSVSSVEIRGLDEEMEENVRTSLSLVDAIGSAVTWRRLAYMMRAAGDETREALEPFGYYAATTAASSWTPPPTRTKRPAAAPPPPPKWCGRPAPRRGARRRSCRYRW